MKSEMKSEIGNPPDREMSGFPHRVPKEKGCFTQPLEHDMSGYGTGGDAPYDTAKIIIFRELRKRCHCCRRSSWNSLIDISAVISPSILPACSFSLRGLQLPMPS